MSGHEEHSNVLLTSLQPREYQIELFQRARQENIIVYLQTGSGKTFIAVLLIREFASEIVRPIDDGGRRVVFIVPTVVLALQQAAYIRRHTCVNVGEYYGALGVDLWTGNRWSDEFQKNNVLVMTAQLFVDAIHHAFIDIKKICLLVLDECHSAVKVAPMKQALLVINEAREKYGEDRMPRILGLTAALFRKKCKPKEVLKIIRTLESSMCARVCTATDIEMALRSSTKPTELICEYATKPNVTNGNHEVAWIVSRIHKLLQETLTELKKKSSADQTNDASGTWKAMSYILHEIKFLADSLGPYGAYLAVLNFMKEMEKILLTVGRNSEHYRFHKQVVETLQEIRDTCEVIFSNIDNAVDRLNAYVSPHVHRLFEILRQFSLNKSKPDGNVTLCSIVFVERRSSANILYNILKLANQYDPELSFLSPLYTVGQASGNPALITDDQTKLLMKQKDVIKRFRDGNCNLLVATSVLEEGIDVRACNLVIRFDGIKTYCDYVQSKGRARSPNAFYIMMVPDDEDKTNDFLDTLAGFHAIEQLLLKPSQLSMYNMADEGVLDDDTEAYWQAAIPPYCPFLDGPRITLASAISLLYRYCSTLPSDGMTILSPYWTMAVIDIENLHQIDIQHRRHLTTVNSCQKFFQYKLLLPLNSILRNEIVGRVMPSKLLAKRDAALSACILLHKEGELDDEHLLPVKYTVDEENDMDDQDCTIEIRPEKNYYPKEIARVFQDQCMSSPFYLYLITYDLANNLSIADRFQSRFNPNRLERRLGFLTTRKLPEINKFPLFTSSGQFNVGFTEMASYLKLKSHDIQLCHRFQRYIFKEVLELQCDDEESDLLCGYLIVPIDFTKRQIDLSFMEEQLIPVDSLWSKPSAENCYKNYEDSVVRSTHVDVKNTELHFVEELSSYMTASSRFPDSAYPTFLSYYCKRYKMEIKDIYQPLLEVSVLSTKLLDYLTPKYLNRKQKGYKIHFLPELCHTHRFPASVWRQLLWIPSIFFRLNSLLLADELRREIHAETGLGQSSPGKLWELLEVKTAPSPLKIQSDEKIKSDVGHSLEACQTTTKADEREKSTVPRTNERSPDIQSSLTNFFCQDMFDSIGDNGATSHNAISNRHSSTEQNVFPVPVLNNEFSICFDDKDIGLDYEGPSPGQILQALTATGANAGFDLERLEILGDSVLKLITSIQIYCSSSSRFHQGKLTQLRSRQVSNDNLCKLGKKKSLPQKLVVTRFLPKENWRPPFFCYNRLDDGTTKDSVTWQKVGVKKIADSVEALIGLYLMKFGLQGAVKIMHWLGFKKNIPSPDAVSTRTFVCDPPSPLLRPDIPLAEAESLLENHLAGFHSLELKLKYSFRNRFYLLEAFSHPSYFHNRLTNCYQRLEFLGDAVFDYLVIRYLYENSSSLSPGQLTDMKSALVNNTTFAVIAVRNEFHRYVKHCEISISRAVDEFVQQQEISNHAMPEKLTFIGTDSDPIAEGNEVPKILGDVFESLVAAIFLDSDMSLDEVWRVFSPIIQPEIEACYRNVPKSPIRMLHELYPGGFKFKTLDNLPDGRLCTAVEIDGHNRLYKAVGKNAEIANNTAAKYALSELQNATA